MTIEKEKLKSVVESLLFVSGEPISFSRLEKITKASRGDVENAIMNLSQEYENKKGGLVIIKKEDKVQLATNSENASYVEGMVKSELQESLSRASLEVLSIVAYRGPIARSGIESIRGVNSSFILRNLLMRGLVERIGNPKDSRGYLYKISFDFLKKLGVADIKEIPDFENLSKDERVNSVVENNES